MDGIESLLKTNKAMEKLKSTNLDDFPSVKKVISHIQELDDEITYQGSEVVNYQQALTYLRSHKDEMVESVLNCLKTRVKVHHPELLTDVLTLLATHGWGRSEDDDFADSALSNLSVRFAIPLQNAGVEISLLGEEWKDMLDYAKLYLNLVQEDYQAIWWKLFNAASSNKWSNILSLIELLFCIPVANGHVERIFSTLKHIKSEKRSSLSEDHLDDLLRISVDGPPLKKWDAGGAINLWWREKQRRQVNDKRAAPKRKQKPDTAESLSESESKTELGLLDCWESFITD